MPHLSAKESAHGGAKQWAPICGGKSTGAEIALHMRSMCGDDLNPLNLNNAVGHGVGRFFHSYVTISVEYDRPPHLRVPNRPDEGRRRRFFLFVFAELKSRNERNSCASYSARGCQFCNFRNQAS
jgi:hypothetical protein